MGELKKTKLENPTLTKIRAELPTFGLIATENCDFGGKNPSLFGLLPAMVPTASECRDKVRLTVKGREVAMAVAQPWSRGVRESA